MINSPMNCRHHGLQESEWVYYRIGISINQLVMIGGYGGWPTTSEYYNGFHCFSDVWMTNDGYNWTQLTSHAAFGQRAWFGHSVFHGDNIKLEAQHPFNNSAYMFLIGGGNIGFNTSSTKQITTMIGQLDCYRSRDGIECTQVNFQEGGSSTGVIQYSSQEWSKTTVNSVVEYLGIWGSSLELFNTIDSVTNNVSH